MELVMPIRFAALLPVSLALSACASQSTSRDYNFVREIAQTRAAMELPPTRASVGSDEPDPDVRQIVRQPLTAESAVKIALLNNRNLRADLYSLGVARGVLVQASLFPNPEFEAAMRVPVESDGPLEWDLAVGFDITDIILRGQRAGVAEAGVDAARYRTAGAVLDLGFRVRLAYYSVLASQQRVELMRTAMAAFVASYETARTLHDAGNINDFDLVTEHAAYEAARIAVAEAEADVQDDRERMNVLLGLHGKDTTWTVEGRLADSSAELAAQEKLESRAVESSLELAEARATMTGLAKQVGLTKDAGWLPDLTVGVQAEHDGDQWEVGPAISGTLPLFSAQRGSVMTRQAEFDQLRERYVATAVEIRAAVRAARNRALSAHERAEHYRKVLLPLRQKVVDQAILQFNAMQLGVFQLLQARRDQLETARAYIETLNEYWRTRAELEQVLAGRLAGAIGPMGDDTQAGSMPSGGASTEGH
jgi:cobalt-zinc-cadmium efflux system outer membrane protein